MAAKDPDARKRAASIASNVSWARTPNRTERTRNGTKASPISLEYWEDRLAAEGVIRPADIPKAAVNARRAHMQQLALKSAATRRRRASARKTSA